MASRGAAAGGGRVPGAEGSHRGLPTLHAGRRSVGLCAARQTSPQP